jgi:hypothetical protein
MGMRLAAGLVALGAAAAAAAQGAVPVTPANFARAETELYMGRFVKEGGLGRFVHVREPVPVEQQAVVRMNRDTLYSTAVIDLDAGPATLVMPEAGKRYMSAQAIDQNHFVTGIVHGAGRTRFTREGVGTRYLVILVRTLVDPANRSDVAAVHRLQDALKVEQPG